MSAVARAANAPSGSMYHRFPTRAALCGELWIRTEERFHAGMRAALATSQEPQTRCVAAARFTVQWCRDHPVEAQVLLTGADALGEADWPVEMTSRRKRLHSTLRRMLAGMPSDLDRVNAAVIDIPYAVVRRHLVARRAIPASADVIVEQCARTLIPAS
jgi:AcrR family transcriptional regulator